MICHIVLRFFPGMDYTLLREISRASYRWKVLVRVARTWEHKSPNGRLLYDIGFIDVDQQNGTMEGLIMFNRIEKFKNEFKEGSVYIIERFNLYDCKKSYRMVDHPLRICFTQRTLLKELVPPPDKFPVYAYEALPFSVLASRNDDNTILSDVVGMITKSTVVLPPSGAATNSKRQLYITDGSATVAVTLWCHYADLFDIDHFREISHEEPVIVLFTGMIVNTFSGLQAFKTTPFTKWYVNIPIPEMAYIRESTKHLPTLTEWHGVGQLHVEPTESTIDDIAMLEPNEIMGERYKLAIKITEIISTATDWWYMSCKDCWKKARKEGDSYVCDRCAVCIPVPRYRLVLHATDAASANPEHSKFAEFTFFGPRGDVVVGKQAEDVVVAAAAQGDTMPVDVRAVVGKEFTVIVTLKDKSLDSDYPCFQVQAAEAILRPVLAGLADKSAPTGLSTPSASVVMPADSSGSVSTFVEVSCGVLHRILVSNVPR